MDKPYLIGRTVAIVETLVDVPNNFAALVQVNPLEKLTYYLDEALKTNSEELVEIVNAIGAIPSPFVDRKAQFHIGYYHQKGEIEKIKYRKDLGAKLAEIRNKKGMSLRDLSEASGLDHSNIGKIENGRYNVGIDILYKICQALDCRIEIMPNKGDKLNKFDIGEKVQFWWGPKSGSVIAVIVDFDIKISSEGKTETYDLLIDGELVEKIPEKFISKI